jgi:hypothetical protein
MFAEVGAVDLEEELENFPVGDPVRVETISTASA